MLEVADETVPDAARERDRPMTLSRFSGPLIRASARSSPKVPAVIGGRLQVVGGRARYQVDRPADRVPSVQGALRPAKHFDAIQVEKPHERHRGPSKVTPSRYTPNSISSGESEG